MAIFRSIFLACIISGVISGISYSLGFDFIKTFLMAFCFQYITYFIISYFRDAFIIINSKRLELAKIEEYNKYGIEVNCAYCNTPNFVPVRLDEDNNFICESCEKSNALYINVTVAQKTEMISSDRLTVSAYISEHENLKSQIISNES